MISAPAVVTYHIILGVSWRGLVWLQSDALSRRIQHPLGVQHGQAAAHRFEKEGRQHTQPTVVQFPRGGGEQHLGRVIWDKGEREGGGAWVRYLLDKGAPGQLVFV